MTACSKAAESFVWIMFGKPAEIGKRYGSMRVKNQRSSACFFSELHGVKPKSIHHVSRCVPTHSPPRTG